ncbi:Aromatic ring-opening dioxygenase, catalytic subunit, LigB family [Roseateles sp. YR242]|uniref:dioxygenase family protein n=1 Tax=Roseateles sp. YR242 TaxID=1855305 RepID=UPI0008C2AD25|nr:class III extradiol ring-cleavage dioxygenase [Roseateles sp. YR242]SEL46519.1 Aromatic ring-opening dioxygenase, catalytic subunit, LigB family [Roseateles sp. YR242]
MTSPFPTLFVSHGSPMIALEPGDTGAFMRRLGQTLDRAWGRPRAVLAVSAHTTARAPVLLGGAQHEAVYDFGGFPEALYDLRYDAPGAPALAASVGKALGAPVLDRGGLDHGIWTALRYLYPDADVPVLPLALTPMASPAELMVLGQQLVGLQEQGVLILATGSITHNLRLLMRNRPSGGTSGEDDAEMPESAAFRTWFADRSAARDWTALVDYRVQAPHAALMHPTDEHLLPWYVAAGAGGREVAPLRLFEGVTFGCLGMDAYAFGPQARALEEALKETAAA